LLADPKDCAAPIPSRRFAGNPAPTRSAVAIVADVR